MSRMTEEERQSFFKATRMSIKHKCDNPDCEKPIVGCLTYNGSQGREFCSRECYNAVDGKSKIGKKEHLVSDEEEVKKKKKSSDDEEEEDETPKKKKKSSDEDEPVKKKKKKKKSSDEEEPVKKKKKKVVDEDEDEPKKKKVASKSGNPFREGSVIAEAFDLCLAGTTRKKLNQFAESKDVGATRILSCMKAEEYRDTKWKYSEDDSGTIIITKKKAAAAE